MFAQTDNTDAIAVSYKRSDRLFWIMISAVVLAFCLVISALVYSDYRRTLGRAELQLQHFAELYEQTVDASLSIANLQMWTLIDEVAATPVRGAAVVEAQFGPLLRGYVKQIEQIDSLVLMNAEGTVLWSTAEGLVGRNVADRDYFQKALQLGRGEYTVDDPITSRATGRRLTPIAWPLLDGDGVLQGVVASSLGEGYFSGILMLSDLDPDMHIEIAAANGEAAFVAGLVNRSDDEAEIRASQEIPALGLVIKVSRSKAAVLNSFWQRSVAFVLIAVVLFLIVIAAAVRARNQSRLLTKWLRRSERDRNNVRAAQREFDTIFDNVGDGIVVYDESNSLFRSNRRARELLGAIDDRGAVRRLRELLPAFSEMESDFALHRIDLSTADPNEESHAIQCRVMKLHLHDENIAYCVLEDVSAEERLAETRAAFVASVNHELRTPLTSLSGALELLQARFAQDIPQNAGKLLSMASRNADRLLVLVNDILTLQAIDQQQLSIQKELVSVGDALREAVSTNSGYGLTRNVTLTSDVRPEHDSTHILADTVRLQQIFSNLISNAIKYTPTNGAVEIGAELEAGRVIFQVSDTGPGIPGSARERLFDRFTKPVHGKETQASGTGLGLAITLELVKRQDGELAFETRSAADGEADPGTTFNVSFPKAREADSKRGKIA